jgi:Ankyrin repeats (many copies)
MMQVVSCPDFAHGIKKERVNACRRSSMSETCAEDDLERASTSDERGRVLLSNCDADNSDSDGSVCTTSSASTSRHSDCAGTSASPRRKRPRDHGTPVPALHCCDELDYQYDLTGRGYDATQQPELPPLSSLMPGQPWGVPLHQRMRTLSNDAILAALEPAQSSMPAGVHPEDFLHQILHERGYLSYKVPSLDTHYQEAPTASQVGGYKGDIVSAVRENDVEALRAMYKAGRCMSACNRYGESIIHMACRRGNGQALAFLMRCGAKVGVTDDFGRTRKYSISSMVHFAISVFKFVACTVQFSEALSLFCFNAY